MMKYSIIDDRPPVCPEDFNHGLLRPYNDTDMECPECGYIRRVLRKTDE